MFAISKTYDVLAVIATFVLMNLQINGTIDWSLWGLTAFIWVPWVICGLLLVLLGLVALVLGLLSTRAVDSSKDRP